ncbi:MAG: hypothetical protein NC124_20650 [Clostridium sp.]|nr:hypothetical protein [Roseburia sp.]MCM1500875.1 hypothetical protein [Clostridium sp.]
MERRWIQVSFVTVFLGVLLMSVCKAEIYAVKEDADLVENETEEYETASFEEYSFFDVSQLDGFRDEAKVELMDRAMHDYAEEIKGEFIPVVPEGCGFPEELVVMMEEILYRSINERIGPYPDDCCYDEKLQELGAGDFDVGLEEAHDLFPKIADYKEQIESKQDALQLVIKIYLEDGYMERQNRREK